MVDEYVLEQLSPKEKIKFAHKVGNIEWIATTKRVLKYTKTLFGKSLRDLDYKHVVSIHLEEKRHTWLIILAICLFFFGVSLLGNDDAAGFGVFLVFLSIVSAVIFILYKDHFYQFHAPSIHLEDWKMTDVKSKESKELIQVIRKHCFYDEKKK